MKKLLFLFFVFVTAQSFAQEKEDVVTGNKFHKERLFTGGSLNLGFSSYSTNIGLSPQFGYSVASWADVGISLNFNYVSQRDVYNGGDKLRQTVYGPGVFARLFPVKFLFASVQYEYNIIDLKYIPVSGSTYTPAKSSYQAPSLLLGAGYAGGREKGNNTYYFFSVSWDVLGDKNSPYIDGYGRTVPVIRAGYNIGLFQRRSRF